MSLTDDSLDLLRKARLNPIEDVLKKGFTQASSAISGLTFYDLEEYAKLLVPVITPFRNATPRESGKGGIQANWRGITAYNVNAVSPGVGEGNRGGGVDVTTKDYIAIYKELGLENFVTFKANLAARNFDDLKLRAVESLLRSLFIAEEKIILGGNTSTLLGTTPTPTGTGSQTGGSLSSGTFSLICVALSHEGFLAGTVAGGIRGAISRTNTDSSVDNYGGGAAKQSVAASIVVGGSVTTGSISASVAPVSNAVGYAWFWGTAGNEVLGAITTINSVLITATATGTQTAVSLGTNDNSVNALVYDGLLTFCAFGNTNGAYSAQQATGTPGTGTPLTADNTGGIVEINTALRSFWDNYRLSPDSIWVSAQEMKNIIAKILGSTSTAAQRFVFDSAQGKLIGGVAARSYLNPFTMAGAAEIPIKLHPNMPPGTILFTTSQLPYPMSNVSNPLTIRERQSYTQIEWPLRTRKWEYGCYVDSVLQVYFPPSLGIITNIANG